MGAFLGKRVVAPDTIVPLGSSSPAAPSEMLGVSPPIAGTFCLKIKLKSFKQ